MLTHNERTEVIRRYRAEYKRQVYSRKPWKAENVQEAFTMCGAIATVKVALDLEEDLNSRAVQDYINAWRNENGLGLDQQELQLREVS